MTRIMAQLPMLAITAFFAMGQALNYAPERQRLLTLGLVLVLLPTVWALGRRGQASPIHRSMAAFIGLVPRPAQELGGWWPVLLYGLFTLMASLPQLRGRPPFTTFFARRQAPQAVWSIDVFRAINRHMSWIWAALFALSGLAASLPLWVPVLAGPLASALCQFLAPAALMLGLGLPLNKHYPAWYQRRLGLQTIPATNSEAPAPAQA